MPQTRTNPQNRSGHKWYKQIADMLNDAGYSQKAILKEPLEVDWTEHSVKDLARHIGKVKYGKKSTAEWTTKEHTEIVDEIIRGLAQKGFEAPPYPSRDALLEVAENV